MFVAVVAGLMAAAALASAAGSPSASGPLTLASGGCQSGGCAFDFVLDPAATPTPSDSWHGYWISTATEKVQPGWCDLDAIANVVWGDTGSTGTLPAATYPAAGTQIVKPSSSAALPVDAGGTATTPGKLQGQGMPAGLVTTWVHPGYLTTLWQGRASVDPSLVMAAELRNPTNPSPSPPGIATDYTIGLPCKDFAPPGKTFLARFAHPTIRVGKTAYLELRIPDTGLRSIITPSLDEQTAIDGKATVRMIGGLGGFVTKTKTQSLRFADRWTYETKPGFGTWKAIVTLRGPTGTRHYRIPLTVKG